MYFHRSSWIYMDLYGISWISMDLNGFGTRMSDILWRPVAACEPLCHPAAADWIPLILRFQILEAWIWRPGAWMPGCLDADKIGMDWRR